MAGQPPAAFGAAFDKLKQSVSPADAIKFQSTTLEDVWKATREIERTQKQRKSLHNLARIKPLLNALEIYSKPVEVLCNGTPYLPWVWAPIKFLLQIASGYGHIFDHLLGAYVQIAEALPRFDRFQEVFGHDPKFQIVLGMVYTDILEFHQHAYKIFKRPAWYIIFGSLWKDFESRFTGILESLARHRELVDKEAISIDIAEARSWRIRAEEDIERREKQRKEQQLHYAMAWLAVDDLLQEEEFDRLSERRQDGTCEWVVSSNQLKAWHENGDNEPILWINGIPGAGKSVLCSHILSSFKNAGNSTNLYYFCNSHSDSRDLCGTIFRTLALQLIRENIELVSYVSDNYAARGLTCSMTQLKELLPNLIKATLATRIIIDGLDECEDKDQKQILQELMKLCGDRCKVLISSRDSGHIGKTLRKKKTLAFRDRRGDIDRDIRLYASQALAGLREEFGDEIIEEIEQAVVKKADGMFLWVRLVIDSILDCHSISELRKVVTLLPEGLDAAYARILQRIETIHNQQARQKTVRILEWIACSRRPLKSYEVQDGIVFTPENEVLDETTKQLPSVFELCKPIIEAGPGNTVDFVHYSAKEYVLNQVSGPFLSETTAHCNITFSCISYLSTSLSLIDPGRTPDEVRIQVLQGYHGLHHYADEFWMDHLLEYFKLKGMLDQPLLSVIDKALEFQKYDLSQSSEEELDKESYPSSITKLMVLVSRMSATPEVQTFIRKLLIFRARSLPDKKEIDLKLSDGLNTNNLDDPSWFSEVSQQYRIIVESLLTEASLNISDGPDARLLADFKRIYGSTAFVCRYHRCPHYSNGFESSMARDEHEVVHKIRYNCPENKCVYASAGFSKFNLLQKHIRKYHSKPEDDVPLLSKQRVQKKRRFEEPEDYTFAPTFLVIPHSFDALQQRLGEIAKTHASHLDETQSRRPDESTAFPSGPSARGLAPRKAFLDFEEVQRKQATPNQTGSFALDYQALLRSPSRTSIVSERWTIPELNTFPKLLEHFGSDWEAIAGVMKTKTSHMIIIHYNSQVDPGKTEYRRLVDKADERRATNAGKEALHGMEFVEPGPSIKDQTQRFYDPLSTPLVIRTANQHFSQSETSTNHADGPFAGTVDRSDNLEGVLPDINLLSTTKKDVSEVVGKGYDTHELLLRQGNPSQSQLGGSKLLLQLQLRNMLQRMQNLNSSWPFFNPVDQYLVIEYHDVIKEPVDLSILEAKVEEEHYSTTQHFFHDVARLFGDYRISSKETGPAANVRILDYMRNLFEESEFYRSRGSTSALSQISKEQPSMPNPDSKTENQKQIILPDQALTATKHPIQEILEFKYVMTRQTDSDEDLPQSFTESGDWQSQITLTTPFPNLIISDSNSVKVDQVRSNKNSDSKRRMPQKNNKRQKRAKTTESS